MEGGKKGETDRGEAGEKEGKREGNGREEGDL